MSQQEQNSTATTANGSTETTKPAEQTATPRQQFGFSIGPFGKDKPEEYPHEYLVTREADWINPTLYESWLQKQLGKSLRFKDVKVHSDVTIPSDLTKKILREVFTTGVSFDRRYFSGLTESVNLALHRFKSVDAFDYAALNVSKGQSGMSLSLFLKGKPLQESKANIAMKGDGIVWQTNLKSRNTFKRLETASMKADCNLFDLDVQRISADVTFPMLLGKYNLRPIANWDVQNINFNTSAFGVRDLRAGIELEEVSMSNNRHTFGVGYQHRSFAANSWLSQTIFGHRTSPEVQGFRTRFPDLRVFGSFSGGRVYYNYEGSSQYCNRYLFGDVQTKVKGHVGLLWGNDKALQLGISNQTTKIATGFGGPKLNTTKFLIEHLVSGEVMQSFDGEHGLLVNNLYHSPNRFMKNFKTPPQQEIEPLSMQLNNQLKISLTDSSNLKEKNSSWFMYGQSRLGLVRKPNRESHASHKLAFGIGYSWHNSQPKLGFNLRLGLLDQTGFSPSLGLDFQEL